jgi:hypothetical protein
MTMIRPVELFIAAVMIATSLPVVEASADVTRCETSGRCPAPAVGQAPSETEALRLLRDNDEDGTPPLETLTKTRRADQDR